MQESLNTTERQDEREAMVLSQLANRGIADKRVLEAMRAVPRHWFIPEDRAEDAYQDRPLPIGEGQTISQPYIVAYMTEVLRVMPGARVLEIGTGSGYQAAVFAAMDIEVFTIEIVRDLFEKTKAIVDARDIKDIHMRTGDGAIGWPDEAPFDAIIFTCATPHVPPALFEQLKIGGRLCAPVDVPGEDGQVIRLWTKKSDEKIDVKELVRVRFVPMTGLVAEDSQEESK